MTENERKPKLSSETQELINSTTKEELGRIEKLEQVQKQHEKEKEDWREVINKVEDKILDLGKEKEKIKDELMVERNEKKALKEALLAQKQKYSTLNEPEERLSYGEKVSKKAHDIIKKRCAMGYYGGEPCRDCKLTIAK